MENNASHILDIHTHKSEDVSHGKAIINYPLPVMIRCACRFRMSGRQVKRDISIRSAFIPGN